MSANRDTSQKTTFVYSNLYQLYRKGKEAADQAQVPAQAPAPAANAAESVADLRQAVFKLYQNTYSDFGMVIPNAEKLAQSRTIAIVRDENGKIASYMLGRQDQFGFLVTQIGADPSRHGIQALSQTLKSYIPDGMYFQTSGHPLSAFKKAGQAPIIPFEVVQKIRAAQGRPVRRPTESELKNEIEKGHLPNDPDVLKNAYYTTAAINGEVKSVIKVMMGKPDLRSIAEP